MTCSTLRGLLQPTRRSSYDKEHLLKLCWLMLHISNTGYYHLLIHEKVNFTIHIQCLYFLEFCIFFIFLLNHKTDQHIDSLSMPISLFRNKRFMLDETTQQYTSKFTMFWNTKTHIVFFVFHFMLLNYFPLMNALDYIDIDQGIH